MKNPIMFWNDVALECNRLDHTGKMEGRNQRGPTLSSRALAMVHIGIHDSYISAKRAVTPAPASGLNDPYLPTSLRPAFNKPVTNNKKTVSAAVSAAASVILKSLYPTFSDLVESSFNEICAANGSDTAGHRFGQQIGRNVINLRRDDGSTVDPDPESAAYMDSADFGRHREDPLNRGQSFLGAGYGNVTMFACNAWHELKGYPAIGTADYLKDHREVRSKGAASHANHSVRTPEETLIGIYWAYDGAKELGTPPRLYNQVVREIAKSNGLEKDAKMDELNRLLFLANIAMADAGIHAWFYKYHFDLWRPVVGIREFDKSMGPATIDAGSAVDADCDPFWRPLGAPLTNMQDAPVRSFTPPFPAYPSGHATFGAAAFQVTRLFFDRFENKKIKADKTDTLAFEFVSDELDGKSLDPDDSIRTRHLRKFNGLHEAIYENSISRIFLGVHWRFDGTSATNAKDAMTATDKVGGVPLGLAIANDIFGQANVKPSPASVVPPTFETSPVLT